MPTFVSELGASLFDTWYTARTYAGPQLLQQDASNEPSIRWAWSPNGLQIARSANGVLTVYTARELSSGGQVVASVRADWLLCRPEPRALEEPVAPGADRARRLCSAVDQ